MKKLAINFVYSLIISLSGFLGLKAVDTWVIPCSIDPKTGNLVVLIGSTPGNKQIYRHIVFPKKKDKNVQPSDLCGFKIKFQDIPCLAEASKPSAAIMFNEKTGYFFANMMKQENNNINSGSIKWTNFIENYDASSSNTEAYFANAYPMKKMQRIKLGSNCEAYLLFVPFAETKEITKHIDNYNKKFLDLFKKLKEKAFEDSCTTTELDAKMNKIFLRLPHSYACTNFLWINPFDNNSISLKDEAFKKVLMKAEIQKSLKILELSNKTSKKNYKTEAPKTLKNTVEPKECAICMEPNNDMFETLCCKPGDTKSHNCICGKCVNECAINQGKCPYCRTKYIDGKTEGFRVKILNEKQITKKPVESLIDVEDNNNEIKKLKNDIRIHEKLKNDLQNELKGVKTKQQALTNKAYDDINDSIKDDKKLQTKILDIKTRLTKTNKTLVLLSEILKYENEKINLQKELGILKTKRQALTNKAFANVNDSIKEDDELNKQILKIETLIKTANNNIALLKKKIQILVK